MSKELNPDGRHVVAVKIAHVITFMDDKKKQAKLMCSSTLRITEPFKELSFMEVVAGTSALGFKDISRIDAFYSDRTSKKLEMTKEEQKEMVDYITGQNAKKIE